VSEPRANFLRAGGALIKQQSRRPERHIDGVGRRRQQQGIAIWRGTYDRLGDDVGGRRPDEPYSETIRVTRTTTCFCFANRGSAT